MPFGDLIFRFDFGVVAAEVCEDIWTRRRPDAPALLLGGRAGGEPLGLALPGGDGPDPARDARHPRRRPPVHAGLREPGRRQRRADLRRRRLRRSRTASRCSTRRAAARAGRRPRSTSTAPCGCAARTPPGGRTTRPGPPRTRPVPTVDIPESEFRTRREALTYPVPAHGSFFLPGPETTRPGRTRFCEDLLDALALGVGDYFEKTGAFRPSASRSRAGATRCSRCSSPTAAPRARSPRRRGACSAPSTCRPATPRPRREKAARTVCEELGVPLTVVSIDEAFERELEAARAMLQPGETRDPAHRAERPGPHPRRSGCGTGPTPRAGCSSRPAT